MDEPERRHNRQNTRVYISIDSIYNLYSTLFIIITSKNNVAELGALQKTHKPIYRDRKYLNIFENIFLHC